MAVKHFFTVTSWEDESIIHSYESKFAEVTQSKWAFSFGAGRMALYAILEALDIKSGDEVILPGYTCVVVPNAVRYRGAKPVYADIDPLTFNIDVTKIEPLIGPRTRALYAQHTFGLPCDVDAIKALGEKYGIPVIEDISHALGATYNGQKVGGLTEVSYCSTDHSKVISTLLGGIVTTSDDKLCQKLQDISRHTLWLKQSQVKTIVRTFILEYLLCHPHVYWIGKFIWTFLAMKGFFFFFNDEMQTSKPTAYPYPCRLSSFQAVLGLSQLDRLSENLAFRRAITADLEKRISWYGNLIRSEKGGASLLRYSFLVGDRKRFLNRFEKYFDLGIWFTSPVHGRYHQLEEVDYVVGSCPIAEYVAQHIVNFPTHERINKHLLLSEVDRYFLELGVNRAKILRPIESVKTVL